MQFAERVGLLLRQKCMLREGGFGCIVHLQPMVEEEYLVGVMVVLGCLNKPVGHTRSWGSQMEVTCAGLPT